MKHPCSFSAVSGSVTSIITAVMLVLLSQYHANRTCQARCKWHAFYVGKDLVLCLMFVVH